MEQTVLSFVDALNNEDFAKARTYLRDDMKFIGVLGSREGADVYMADMEKMKFKYKVRKVFANGGDVALFYHIDMGGVIVFASGWYQLEDGKIKLFQVLFEAGNEVRADHYTAASPLMLLFACQ